MGIDSVHGWVEAYKPYSIKDLTDRYHNPMLFLFSEDDIREAAAPTAEIIIDVRDFMLSLNCDRYIRLFTRTEGASSHCQMGGLSYAQAAIFNWLNQIFGGVRGRRPRTPPPQTCSSVNSPNTLRHKAKQRPERYSTSLSSSRVRPTPPARPDRSTRSSASFTSLQGGQQAGLPQRPDAAGKAAWSPAGRPPSTLGATLGRGQPRRATLRWPPDRS